MVHMWWKITNFFLALTLGCWVLYAHGVAMKAVERAKRHHQHVGRASFDSELEVMFSIKHSNADRLEEELLKVEVIHIRQHTANIGQNKKLSTLQRMMLLLLLSDHISGRMALSRS